MTVTVTVTVALVRLSVDLVSSTLRLGVAFNTKDARITSMRLQRICMIESGPKVRTKSNNIRTVQNLEDGVHCCLPF